MDLDRLIGRTRALLDLGRWTDAEDSARRLLAEEPTLGVAHCQLAHALLGQGRVEEAYDATRAAIREEPDDEWPYRLMSLVLLHEERYDEAVVAAERAAALAPHQPDVLYNLGFVHQSVPGVGPHLSRALEVVNTALRSAPHHAPFYTLAGITLEKMGDRRQSRRAIREAIRLDPLGVYPINNMAAVKARRGRLAEAATMWAAALASAPNDAVLLKNLDALFFRVLTRWMLILCLAAFVLRLLLLGPVGGPPFPWATRAVAGAVVLALDAWVAWHVLRRLPRASLVLARTLFTRTVWAGRIVIAAVALMTVSLLGMAFGPLAVAQQCERVWSVIHLPALMLATVTFVVERSLSGERRRRERLARLHSALQV